jgi:hypothetical protein
MEPTAGLTDQLTAVFELPTTVAANCCVCEAESAIVPGPTVTDVAGATGHPSDMAIAFTAPAPFVRVQAGAAPEAVFSNDAEYRLEAPPAAESEYPPLIDETVALANIPCTITSLIPVSVSPMPGWLELEVLSFTEPDASKTAEHPAPVESS